jgi:hypothetical protein
MLDLHVARDRAVRRAIATGEMPNLDLIQTIQLSEGHRPCFGRADEYCPYTACRWHLQCMTLAAYQATAPLASPPHDKGDRGGLNARRRKHPVMASV